MVSNPYLLRCFFPLHLTEYLATRARTLLITFRVEEQCILLVPFNQRSPVPLDVQPHLLAGLLQLGVLHQGVDKLRQRFKLLNRFLRKNRFILTGTKHKGFPGKTRLTVRYNTHAHCSSTSEPILRFVCSSSRRLSTPYLTVRYFK